VNPFTRLRQIAPAKDGLSLVSYIATGNMPWLENYLHEAFSHLRVRGEWFDLSETDVAAFVGILSADHVDELPSSIVAQRCLNENAGFRWGKMDSRAAVPVCDGVTRLVLDPVRHALLMQYCNSQTVPPPVDRVIKVALTEFLKDRGFWPPKKRA